MTRAVGDFDKISIGQLQLHRFKTGGPAAAERDQPSSPRARDRLVSHIPASNEAKELESGSLAAPGSFSFILQSHNGRLRVIDNSTYQELHLHSSSLLQKQFKHVAHLYSNYLALLTVDRDEVSIVGDLFSEHEQALEADTTTNSARESDPSSTKQKQVLIMQLQKFDRVKF